MYGQTQPVVRIFLWIFTSVAIGSALITQFTPFPLSIFLSLSPWGIFQGFAWQFLTYPLVVPAPLSFFFVIYLAFVLYLLWMIGNALIERLGTASIVKFFFLVILAAGGVGFLVSLLTTGAPLAGITPFIYALLVAWATFYPDMQLFLFLVLPVRAKWLVTALLAFTLISDGISHNWVSLSANAVSAAIGFLVTYFIWLGNWQPKHKTPSPEDQQFVERMLTKISTQGKESLTLWERWRMQRISKRRR